LTANQAGCSASGEIFQIDDAVLRCIFLPVMFFCASASLAVGAEGFYSAAQAARGEQTYQQFCSACHGVRLQGTPAAPLTGESFRGRWEDGKHTLDDLYYIIRSLMPNNAPGSLSKAEYADVVAFILKANNYPAGEQDLVPKPGVMKAIVLQPH
jgi:cytochrome c5